MKKTVLVIVLAFLAVPAFADISNSTSYKAIVFFSTGSPMNSTNYNVLVTQDDTLGISSSAAYRSCIGYVCVEFGPLGEIIRITFLFQTNLTEAGNGAGFVDTFTQQGIYKPDEINKFFGCVEDDSVNGKPAYGVAFAGSRLNYIKLDKTNGIAISLSQEEPLNKFILPVTNGGCGVIRARMPLGFPFTPFVPFDDLVNAIELSSQYPINLIGQYERTGKFTLVLEKTDSGIVGDIR